MVHTTQYHVLLYKIYMGSKLYLCTQDPSLANLSLQRCRLNARGHPISTAPALHASAGAPGALHSNHRLVAHWRSVALEARIVRAQRELRNPRVRVVLDDLGDGQRRLRALPTMRPASGMYLHQAHVRRAIWAWRG